MSERAIGWSFVGVQALLIVALIIVPDGDLYELPSEARAVLDAVFWIGVALAVAAGIALGRSLTATPVPRTEATLRTSGPYRLVRHPIYTGVVLIVIATAVRSEHIVGLVLGGATIAFFHVKADWEEQRLAERFSGYAEYAAHTPRFVPSPASLTRR